MAKKSTKKMDAEERKDYVNAACDWFTENFVDGVNVVDLIHELGEKFELSYKEIDEILNNNCFTADPNANDIEEYNETCMTHDEMTTIQEVKDAVAAAVKIK